MRFTACSLALAISLASQTLYADTLRDVYDAAVQNDPVIKAQQAEFRAAQETRNIARSQLLPQVGGQYAVGNTEVESSGGEPIRLSTDPNIPPIDLSSDSDVDTKTTTLSLTQSIFDLNKWFKFKSGTAVSEQAKAKFADDQQELIVRSAETYFNVLRSQDNLASSKSEEAAIQRQLEQTKQRFDVGLIAITDVHEAQAANDLARVARLADEGQLNIAFESLTVLTGRVNSGLWQLAETYPITNPTPATVNEWVDAAVKNNYSLKAAHSGTRAAHEDAQAAKAQHYPTVDGSYSWQDQELDGDLSAFSADETKTKMWAVTLKVPIFAGGGISAQRRQAYERYNATRDNEDTALRNTIATTRSLHIAVTTDVLRVSAYKQSITSAQSALDATRAGYEVGTRNVVDVLNAQRTLFRARRDYANARYDFVINQLKLKKQAGSLSPQDIYDLNKWLQAPAA
jgi:outer membrane protein